MTITNPQISDSGRYTCRAKANLSNHDEVMLMVNQRMLCKITSLHNYLVITDCM